MGHLFMQPHKSILERKDDAPFVWRLKVFALKFKGEINNLLLGAYQMCNI